MVRWRGRGHRREQVGNACDSFVDLSPADVSAAAAVVAAWSVLLPGQEVPLIGEVRDGVEEDEFC